VTRGFDDKQQRDRSFSHDADELASYGDGSFIHDQEGFFMQLNENHALELELDFDELHDLVNDLKPEKSQVKDGPSATSDSLFQGIIDTTHVNSH